MVKEEKHFSDQRMSSFWAWKLKGNLDHLQSTDMNVTPSTSHICMQSKPPNQSLFLCLYFHPHIRKMDRNLKMSCLLQSFFFASLLTFDHFFNSSSFFRPVIVYVIFFIKAELVWLGFLWVWVGIEKEQVVVVWPRLRIWAMFSEVRFILCKLTSLFK